MKKKSKNKTQFVCPIDVPIYGGLPKNPKEPERLYRKIGRCYEKSHEFFHDPAEGIWIVQKTGHSLKQILICRLADLPDIVPLTKLEMFREQVQEALNKHMGSGDYYSPVSIVDTIFRVLAKEIACE
jgi:hypothetical protein